MCTNGICDRLSIVILGQYPRSTSWSVLHWHHDRYSVDTWLTLDQQSVECWLTHMYWSKISQLSTEMLRECRSSVNQGSVEGIDGHSTVDAFSTHDPALLLLLDIKWEHRACKSLHIGAVIYCFLSSVAITVCHLCPVMKEKLYWCT